MRKKWIIITTIVVLLTVSAACVGPIMSQTEQPKYTVMQVDNDIEMRQYAPMIIAQVEVTGRRSDAIRNGFRLVADYIFGNNSVQKSISMTRPVQQQDHEKIAMTTPVQQESTGTSWRVSFVMPAEYTLQTLPIPRNDRVLLKEIPAQKFAVIQFSGFHSDDNMKKHEQILMNYIQDKNIKTVGSPKYAFYNPPWTLPFLRRNEIMVEMAEPQIN